MQKFREDMERQRAELDILRVEIERERTEMIKETEQKRREMEMELERERQTLKAKIEQFNGGGRIPENAPNNGKFSIFLLQHYLQFILFLSDILGIKKK